jgi:hypothetical protein
MEIEEDALASAFDPCGLLSPATEEDMQCTLLHSIWRLSRDMSLGSKGLLGKGSLLLWPNRIDHNNTPLPALAALTCCPSNSFVCQHFFLLLHGTLDFFTAACANDSSDVLIWLVP